jgi:hypothetical protein
MVTTLSEEIQAALDALALAESQAALVTLAMRKGSVYLGLEYNHVEDDIANIITRVRYMQYLAKRRKAERPRAPTTNRTERQP